MDEVVLTIRGRKHWLWRAVDQQGFVLDVLVQGRRDRVAAQRVMRKSVLKSIKPPRVMITDKLKSYGAACKDMGLGIEHRQHKGLNNQAEHSHLPTRRRERIMKRFKSPRQVQKSFPFTIKSPISSAFPITSNRPLYISCHSHPGLFNLGRGRGRAAGRMTLVAAIPPSSRHSPR
jgi:putative transposase